MKVHITVWEPVIESDLLGRRQRLIGKHQQRILEPRIPHKLPLPVVVVVVLLGIVVLHTVCTSVVLAV